MKGKPKWKVDIFVREVLMRGYHACWNFDLIVAVACGHKATFKLTDVWIMIKFNVLFGEAPTSSMICWNKALGL
jgi:hypothetical protein